MKVNTKFIYNYYDNYTYNNFIYYTENDNIFGKIYFYLDYTSNYSKFCFSYNKYDKYDDCGDSIKIYLICG